MTELHVSIIFKLILDLNLEIETTWQKKKD